MLLPLNLFQDLGDFTLGISRGFQGSDSSLVLVSDLGLSCGLTSSFIKLGLRCGCCRSTQVESCRTGRIRVVSLGSPQDQCQHTSLQLEELQAKVAREVWWQTGFC